jgi:surfactin synthase thioesterase subunit
VTAGTEWFVPMAGDSRPRLITFPHAGAGCAQLAPFARAVARHGVSVWSANLPGRQARLDEPAHTDFATLVDELADAAIDSLTGPYTLFGYCGGALLAFGLARALRSRSAPLPERLVVASAEAPDIARRPRRLAGLSADQLWAYLRESGALPTDVEDDPRLRLVAEPAVRADFTVLAGYRHERDLPLPVPVTVCFGTGAELPRGALLGWRRHTTHPVEMVELPGGYWLLDDAGAELAAVVAAATRGRSR